jgi:hypothetical protein
MLFVQCGRDAFGTPAELAPVVKGLIPPSSLRIVEPGDHSFKMSREEPAAQADHAGRARCADNGGAKCYNRALRKPAATTRPLTGHPCAAASSTRRLCSSRIGFVRPSHGAAPSSCPTPSMFS